MRTDIAIWLLYFCVRLYSISGIGIHTVHIDTLKCDSRLNCVVNVIIDILYVICLSSKKMIIYVMKYVLCTMIFYLSHHYIDQYSFELLYCGALHSFRSKGKG